MSIEGAVGSAHDDLLSGTASADWLSGGAGNDTLLGLAGRDQLFGGTGDDRLDGGAGNDLLVGGRGADLFAFGLGSGTDQIRDFEASVDRVQLSGPPPANFADFLAAFETTPSGVVIHAGNGSSLIMVGINGSQLEAEDFFWA